MLTVGEDQEKTHLQLSFHFIQRCLEVNRNSQDSYLDGQAIMNYIIAILENLRCNGQGLMDNDFPQLISFVLDEL